MKPRRAGFAIIVHLLFAALLASCSKADPVEQKLAGPWQTVFNNEYGRWIFTSNAQSNGQWRIDYQGPFAMPPETGTLEARKGKWTLKKNNGDSDSGTYEFLNDDTVVFTGAKSKLTWMRMQTPAAVNPAVAAPAAAVTPAPQAAVQAPPLGVSAPQLKQSAIAPPKLDWPAAGFPQMAGKALEQARAWQADAILIEIEARLLEKMQYGQYIETAEGRVELKFIFDSPRAQKRLIITPYSPGNETYELRGVTADPSRALPAEFLDLPQAVEQARARGMKSNVPTRVELRVAQKGMTDGVEELNPPAWHIFGSSYIDHQGFVIPAVDVPAPTVRVVDPAALLGKEEAENILGKRVSVMKDESVQDVWKITYTAFDSNSFVISLAVDESPFRDKWGVIEREQRQRYNRNLEGIGDAATLFDSPAGFCRAAAVSGETLIELQLGLPNARNRAQVAEELLRKIVRRFEAGQGARREAAPQQSLAGVWVNQWRGMKRRLEIAEDGAWQLTLESRQSGVEFYQGSLDWSGHDRNRARFVSPQRELSWLYTAKLLDADQLEVQARNLTGQVWQREGR